ncbi:Os08g0293250, partial [Oryza sativa Japonica Group]
ADAATSRHLPLPLRQRDTATHSHDGLSCAEAGEGEVGHHEQGQRRRRPLVEDAPRAADGAQPGPVLDEGEAADNEAEDVRREKSIETYKIDIFKVLE